MEYQEFLERRRHLGGEHGFAPVDDLCAKCVLKLSPAGYVARAEKAEAQVAGLIAERDEALMSAECSREWRMRDRTELLDRVNGAEAEVQAMKERRVIDAHTLAKYEAERGEALVEVGRLTHDIAIAKAKAHNLETEVARLTEENAALVRDSARLRVMVARTNGDNAMLARLRDDVIDVERWQRIMYHIETVENGNKMTFGYDGPGTFRVTVEKKIG